MQIRIELDDTDPPRGRTFAVPDAVSFGGWLELIRALQDVIGSLVGTAGGDAVQERAVTEEP